MNRPDALRLELLTVPARPPSWDGTLGAALFAEQLPTENLACPSGMPLARVCLARLGEPRAVIERWRIGAPVRSGAHRSVGYAHGKTFLFGALQVPEADGAHGRTALERATEHAYREIHAALGATGFPHLLRVWNYLPGINRESHGTERYRQFNRARQDALLACGRRIRGSVPAASALGSAAGPLAVYFLAGRAAPECLENPRQVSAYHYPGQYGPCAPSFSRATLVRHGGATLFISGTSSILGHRTVHAGDPAAQTRETLTNIEALLEAARRRGAGRFPLESLAYKVYVRHPQDLPLIRAELDAAVGAAARVYLQADICRHDLSVEIEAVGERT